MSKTKPTGKRLLSLALLLCTFQFFAQQSVTVAYGEKIDLGRVDNDVHFYISGASGNTHLRGAKINEYVFATPGTYKIKVKDKKSHGHDNCGRVHLPEEITVNVSRIRMIFKPHIELSKPIVKNQQTEGTLLSIPVTIETFDHKPLALNFTPVQTAGIGTAIFADLNPATKMVSEGNHNLTYALRGVATENSFLMFDFIDANGNVQSVSMTKPVSN